MSGLASLEAADVPMGRTAAVTLVCRYHPEQGQRYEPLLNVRVLEITAREGPDPGIARFRYVFEYGSPSTIPSSFQQAMSTDSSLPGVVQNDDRLVVFTSNSDGLPEVLFDGFA